MTFLDVRQGASQFLLDLEIFEQTQHFVLVLHEDVRQLADVGLQLA